MNRRVWISVLGIVGTLGAASALFAPRASDAKGGAAVARSAAKALAVATGWVSDRLTWDLVGILAVAALVSLLLFLRRRPAVESHAAPWKQVIELGHQGRSISSIAQATRQPQDAVRILLAPVATERSHPRGKAFRSKAPPRPRTEEHRQGREST